MKTEIFTIGKYLMEIEISEEDRNIHIEQIFDEDRNI